jgi:hypothetical protein
MKYSIKVMVYRGKLIYVPQVKKGWFFWNDLIYDDLNGGYDDWKLSKMESEEACLSFIEEYKLYELDYTVRKLEEEEFIKNNPTKYINLGE